MKEFIENVQRMVTENEFQAAAKEAILDIAREGSYEDVERVLDDVIINTQNALNRAFMEKIYKMLSSKYMTKRLIAQYSLS